MPAFLNILYYKKRKDISDTVISEFEVLARKIQDKNKRKNKEKDKDTKRTAKIVSAANSDAGNGDLSMVFHQQ